MQKLSIHSRLILRHIATADLHSVSVMELVRFSPADGSIVDAKDAARNNAEAIEELICHGLIHLWVIDRWQLASGPDDQAVPAFEPDLVLYRTTKGEELHAAMAESE